ncbi:MAG: acylneuraminate cytidylyltransferase family protein [bacterium]
MKYLAIIPARGGSKGIKYKNRKLLNGKPLIQYTIEAAQQSIINEVVVSTDDKEIASIAESLGVSVIMRPSELAKDDTPTLPVIQHALGQYAEQYNAIITLQPTSPLRTYKHINAAISLFEKDEHADSLVSVVKVPHNMVPEAMMKVEGSYIVNCVQNYKLRRQDKPNYLARNGAAIYITKREQLNYAIFGGKIIGYEMSKIDSLDIDEEDDFYIAEALIAQND